MKCQTYVLKLGLCQATIVNSIDNSTSSFERATLANTEFPSGPTSVDEPALGASFRHALCQHGSVARWVQDNERLTEASRESWRRFCDAVFCAWSFRGVAHDEPAICETSADHNIGM